MSHTVLEWHLHPQAQALIGMIAAAGCQAQQRPVLNPASSRRAPDYRIERYFDCPEFGQLELLLNDARGRAMDAGNEAYGRGVANDEAFADFIALTRVDLATLIETEIARRGLQVAA